VTDRLFVDLTTDGRVSVSTWLEGELPGGAAGESRPLAWPLDADALEDLRWYLEDYLRTPFGVYEDRGPGVAARLSEWGHAVFRVIFGPGPARDAYQRMWARNAGLQVVFRSGSARWLGLPWELMRDPARELPLALDAGVAGIDRSLAAAELGASFDVAGSGRLRVLMVISRPSGLADVGFRMIARPLLERLEAVRGQVELVVLRPPTLEALAGTLSHAEAAGEPFQVVHFDGHGVLQGRRAARSDAPGMYKDIDPEGVLVFQTADGGRDPVSASRVAQVLAAARVPIVVLNACQSGAVGKQLEAAVATRLLHGGAASVVAMAYSVYAVAAAEFMTAFYERLFAGDTISAAVTAGRQRLFRHAGRPSPKGDLPLADWLVPVHYLRREVRLPGLVTARPAGAPSLEEALNQLAGSGPGAGEALAPVGGFTGRDGLFYALETAARLQKVVLLCGPAGTGKTELAKAFGRWWQDTGGVERPEWVFWHSFEPGLASFGLDAVIAEVGLAVFGPDFARLDNTQRGGVVEGFLRDHRALLIWDNFESVRSIPASSEAMPPLDEAGCQQLRGFLQTLAAGGHSAVLVTSRSDEPWLGDGTGPGRSGATAPVILRRIQVDGLTPEEATQYAGDLLAAYPAAAPRRADRAFGELMQWLDGHPLSMRLVLPHLDTTNPGVLLAGLHGTAPLPGWDDGLGGRLTSLPASLGYSYGHLGPTHRRLLAAVSLFRDYANADVLGEFSAADGVPRRFQEASREAWGEALDAAAGAGLLTRLGLGMYRLHPALPAFLAARWHTEEGGRYDAQRAAATQALLAAYTAFALWLVQQIDSGDAGLAYTVIGLQQRTMGHLLSLALDSQSWTAAHAIGEPLTRYWHSRGQYAETAAWTDRVSLATEDTDGSPPALDSPAGNVWHYFVGAQALQQLSSGQWDAADLTLRAIVATLQVQPVSAQQQFNLGASYNQLGILAQQRGRPEEAAGWYTKSLAIMEELGDRPGLAQSYHQLGLVAQQRGQLEKAEDLYSRSLVINEELGNRPATALNRHQLGNVAWLRGRLEEAEDWHVRSLAIKEELGDRPGTALSYGQLGMVAQERGRLEEAEDWQARSLAINEELGNRPGTALNYHRLGVLAQGQRRLEEAADWYNRALAIRQAIGDRTGEADIYHQLGNVAFLRSHLEEAAEWYARSLAINEEVGYWYGTKLNYYQLGLLAEKQGSPDRALEWMVKYVALADNSSHPSTGSGPKDLARLARLARQLGIPRLEACWQQVTGDALPGAVRDYVRSDQAEPGDTSEGAHE
jgi:tetratricopeptide (TPR) repeat protein